MVRGDELQNSIERANFEGGMRGDRNVVLAVTLCRQTQVRTILANNFVGETTQCFSELQPAQIPWNLHAVRTSSRTK